MRITPLTLALLMAGCSSIEMNRLPNFDRVGQRTGSRAVLVTPVSQYDESSLPEFVPYCILFHTSSGRTRAKAIRQLWHRADELGADLVWASEREMINVGAFSTYLGFGITKHTPSSKSVVRATLFRRPPGRLGLGTDEEGMVVLIDGDGPRDAGLLEGDRILSVDGALWSKPGDTLRAPRFARLSTAKPGDQLKLVWIRPGVGRMEGDLEVVPNRRLPEIEPSVSWESPWLPDWDDDKY